MFEIRVQSINILCVLERPMSVRIAVALELVGIDLS